MNQPVDFIEFAQARMQRKMLVMGQVALLEQCAASPIPEVATINQVRAFQRAGMATFKVADGQVFFSHVGFQGQGKTLRKAVANWIENVKDEFEK